ncbi:MAG TPA: VWA domain-containing protein [Pirellulales bacterium]|nr:VWA domain-containing protein [Pirellulales bacterium]
MSVRIPAALVALTLLTLAADTTGFVRADDQARTGKKVAVAKAVTKTAEDAAKDEFRAAKREIQGRLRSKQVPERIAAVRQLNVYRGVEAARLLVTVGLQDDEPSVRDAAYHQLLDFNDDLDIARYLLQVVKKDGRRADVNPTTFQLLAVLLASKSPDVEREVGTYLEKQTSSHEGLLFVQTFADELGEHGQVEDVSPLAKLTKLRVFAAEFGLRRAIAEALMKIGAPEAVGELVTLMERVQGEIRAEIVKHLIAVTGEDFGLEVAAWREWWKANKKEFQMAGAPRKDGTSVSMSRLGRESKFYGLSIHAQKMVFIIDTSGSMVQGGRLNAAKRELLQAIDGLTEDAQFSVLAFNGEVYAWRKQLMPANAAVKETAAHWVATLETGTNTASYDALEAGLQFDAEAIFFLTDGVPQGGNINNPADIVALITRGNRLKRMSIYTIGIGPQGGGFEQFLATLARQNWGAYRRVDQ